MSAPLAVITGASSGIGREIARALAQRNWRTAVISRDKPALRAITEELNALAPSFAVPLDLCECDSIEPALQRMVEQHGPPSLLINNAGFGMFKPFLSHAHEDLDLLMRMHYYAPASAIRALLPHMLRLPHDHHNLRGARAHVINVASMSVKIGPWGHAGYAAAKSALRALTHTLAAEHASDGVRWTVLLPGIVTTPFFAGQEIEPLYDKMRARAIPASKVAKTVMGLLGSRRVEVCIPGHYRALDAIAAISPTLAHRIVARQSAPPPDRLAR